MLMNQLTWTSVGADYNFLQINPDTRRCRFIAHTADVSALGSLHTIPMYELKFIIGPGSFPAIPAKNDKA